MIAIAGQTWLALAMIALAAIYLARCTWRALRGQSHGPGCCSTGCTLASPDTAEPEPKKTRGNFVPLENLADLARRHKEGSNQ